MIRMPRVKPIIELSWIDKCCGVLPMLEEDVKSVKYCSCGSELDNEDFDENDFAILENGEPETGTNGSEIHTISRRPSFPDLVGGPVELRVTTSKKARSYTEMEDENYDELVKISIADEPVTKSPFCECILPSDAMKQIALEGLPPALLFSTWKRVYSLARDGDSFETMLRLVKDESKSLLVVRTIQGETFGGFVARPWTTESNGTFYGSGESLLFRILRTPPSQTSNNDSLYYMPDVQTPHGGTMKTETVKLYKWSGANQHIQVCHSEKIGLGGGGTKGSFGLCIDRDLKRGSTGKCETFENEPLTEDGREFFEILDLEIWGFSSWILM